MTRPARPRGAAASQADDNAWARRRPVRDRLLGLLSLLTLLTLITGVPAALVALRGNPLPHAGLNRAALVDALTRPDDGSLFLGALAWLAWAGWAMFTLSVLVEVPAHVRGLPSPRLPALGLSQRAASSLVAGAALLFSLPSLSFPTQPMVSRPAAVVSVQQPELSLAATSLADVVTQPATSTAPTLPRYTVVPGDSLWRIAQEQLGDGNRYHEIANLNYGDVQADGRTLTRDHWIRPGWILTLPDDAARARVPGSSPARGTEVRTVVVQKGDTLSQIAQDTLGDGSRYTEIADASTGVQPDGLHLTDANLIKPGWKLTIPNAAGSATPLRTDRAPAEKPKSVTPPPRIAPPAEPAPLQPDGSNPAGAEPSRPSPAQAPAADHAADTKTGSEEDTVTVRTAGGVGALLAAGLLALLASRRARQQRRRGPGQRIAMPTPDLAAAETELRLSEDPSGLRRVDQALRTLSMLLGEQSRSLPGLRLARLTGSHLELTLVAPETLPAPFTGMPDQTVWVLPAQAALPTAARLATVPAPYPSLVTVGQDSNGGQILLDLEHTGALAAVGNSEDEVAVLAAIAAELATSPWADDLQITLVGCLDRLPAALGTGRVRHVDHLEQVLPTLEKRVAAVRAALQRQDLKDLRQARTARPNMEEVEACWPPEILLMVGPVAPALRTRLLSLLLDLPPAGLSIVTAGDVELTAWRLTFGTAEAAAAMLEPLNLALQPQRLTTPDLDHLVKLLAVADRPSELPDARGTGHVLDELRLQDMGSLLAAPANATEVLLVSPTPSQPPLKGIAIALDDQPAVPLSAEQDEGPGDDDAGTGSRALMIQVLGPVEILNARGPVEPSKVRQLTEIAAFMALHPGSDRHGLSEAIWPGARALDNTRNTAVSKLRKWLGCTDDGTDYVPWVLDDGYRLHPHVTTDWQLWRRLLPDGPGTASNADLAAALELVKGRPFAGTNPRRYAWAERERQDMISAIVDASHILATRALLAGDATLARRAAAAGLHVDPGIELLWRDALKADWLAGDREGLVTTADRLSALVEELGDDLEPETIELMDELLRRQSRQVGAR
jgi:LysM repeat protein